MKITTEMTKAAYAKAKDIYEEKIEKNEALDFLEIDCGMNRGSAKDYIQGFKKMMQGEKYTRTFNTEATEYYLEKIYHDYGPDALKTALQAVNKHVDYYENLGRGNLNSIREVVSQYEPYINNLYEIYPDEISQPEKLTEGQTKKVFVNVYERNVKAREKCIEFHGIECSVCRMHFEQVYGKIGRRFIHVHHVRPLAKLGRGYEIDPINDLRPVCPNCHAMLHRQDPPLTIDALIELMNA